MFENILIPISSEYYNKPVIERAIFLAEQFNSKITLFYILEKKPVEQVEKKSDSYRTTFDRDEIKKDVIRQQIKTADQIIFQDAKNLFKNKNIDYEERIIEGAYGEIIKKELNKKEKKYDLVLMSCEKGCLIDYSFFYQLDVPIWIESKVKTKSILAVCSNLAPNQKVPDLSIKLSKTLGWDLKMIYVIDKEDTVNVDKNGERSQPKPKKVLQDKGQIFVDKMRKKGIDVETIEGNLQKSIDKTAKKQDSGLVILGREQKKKGALGIPAGNIKRKIAEKCDYYSIIFVN